MTSQNKAERTFERRANMFASKQTVAATTKAMAVPLTRAKPSFAGSWKGAGIPALFKASTAWKYGDLLSIQQYKTMAQDHLKQ